MSDEPMTVEAAIEAVKAMDAPESEAPPETGNEVQDAASGDTQGGEIVSEDTEGAEADTVTDEEATTEEEAEEAAAPVEAPQWWDADAKAHFAKLTPEAQAIVRAQEDKREAVVQKAKDEANQARTAAKQDVERAKALAERLAEAIPDQRKQFDQYYADIDWEAYVEQDPIAAQKDWFRYQQGLQRFNEAETAKAEAERLWRENFIREEGEKLKEIAPDLLEKPESLRAVGDFLIKSGIPAENIQTASAVELALARDAMLYRQMKAEAEAKAKQTPPKTASKPARVPPSGAAQPRNASLEQREAERALNSFRQTKSREGAIDLVKKMKW